MERFTATPRARQAADHQHPTGQRESAASLRGCDRDGLGARSGVRQRSGAREAFAHRAAGIRERMASCAKLDAPRGARRGKLILLLLALSSPAFAQQTPSDASRLAAAQKAFDCEQWEEAARLSQGLKGQSAELDFLRG